jgi:hypothetical protein
MVSDTPDISPSCTDMTLVSAPYCPDSALRIAGPLIQLSGLVNSVRVCGFNADYAQFVISQLFDIPMNQDTPFAETKGLIISKVSPWPRMKGQTSYIDIGKGKNEIVLDNHDLPMPLGEDEKQPVSYFDEDFGEPDELSFKQRSVSFTTKLVKSLRELKEKNKESREAKKSKDAEVKELKEPKQTDGAHKTKEANDHKEKARPGTSGGNKAATEEPVKETKKQRNARVRRSMSLGSVPVSATPWEEHEKTSLEKTSTDQTVSRISLRKQVSNFTLRSKASKKSLNTSEINISQGQDSETLIPDVPPIPQQYRDAGYAKPSLTESTTKYGPTVKGTKIETQALLDGPRTPTPTLIPKKSTETPSRLRLFKRTPKKSEQEEPVAQEPKTPAKPAVSFIPRPSTKRPTGSNIDKDQTRMEDQKPVSKVTPQARTAKISTPDTASGSKISASHAIDQPRFAQDAFTREPSSPFQTMSTGSMPPTDEEVSDNLIRPRLRPQQSNMFTASSKTLTRDELAKSQFRKQLANMKDSSTFIPYRDPSTLPRTRPQHATPLAPGELAMPRPRLQPQETFTLDPGEVYMPRPRARHQQAAVLDYDEPEIIHDRRQQVTSAYDDLDTPRPRPQQMAPHAHSEMIVPRARPQATPTRQAFTNTLTRTYADRSMNPFLSQYTTQARPVLRHAASSIRARDTFTRPTFERESITQQEQQQRPLRTMRSEAADLRTHPNMESFRMPNHASSFHGRGPHATPLYYHTGRPSTPEAAYEDDSQEETMIDGIDPNRSQYEIIRPSLIPGSGSGRRYAYPAQAVSESSTPTGTSGRQCQEGITPSRNPFLPSSNRGASERGQPIAEDEDSEFF